MAEDSDLERTEPASGRKLQKAREEGNVPRSREFSTLAVLLASGAVFGVAGINLFEGLRRMMRDGLSFGRGDVADIAMMTNNLYSASLDALWVFLPVAGVVLAAAVVSNLAISGWVFTMQAIEANFDKLDPMQGLARMFSAQAVVELVKALLKGLLIGGVAGWMIWTQHEAILGLASEPLEAAMPHFGRIILFTYLAAVAAFALIAALDVPYQLWEYHRKLRMTKEEVRQEGKETEGDPQIKARIRALQREMARRRMMQAVPKADVVVINPTRFAVALKYEEKGMNAPQVVAKGSALLAQRIREIAQEHRVPIVEAPPLARALHRHVEVGDAIPDSLFTAVAQVLAYVYQLNQHLRPRLPEDWRVPAHLDPEARAT
jgi:flagellar biosynthetic protein FlhB